MRYFWWGYWATFDQNATRVIAAGYGALVGGIGGPLLAAVGLAIAQQIASNAIDDGKCLQMVMWWSGAGYPRTAPCP